MSEVRSGSLEVLEANPLDEINHLVQIARMPEILNEIEAEGAEFEFKKYYELPDYKFLKATPRLGNEYKAYAWEETRLGQPKKTWRHKIVSAEEPMIVKAIYFDVVTGVANPEPIVLKDVGFSFGTDYRLGLKPNELIELFNLEIVDKREMAA